MDAPSTNGLPIVTGRGRDHSKRDATKLNLARAARLPRPAERHPAVGRIARMREPLPPSVLHGLVMQTRDDIGTINNLIIVTNALLAGILAALVAQFLL
jgi:hypothetical protein